MTPLVTVITPTYRHGRFIAEAIASVRAQTYGSWEQLVVDDGSDDDTVAVARAAAGGDPRIDIHVQPHRGVERLAETYNGALQRARGELVAILEGDDLWPADKLATLVPCFDDPAVVLAYGLTEVVAPDGRPIGVRIPTPAHRRTFGMDALRNRPVGAATKAMLHTAGLTFTFPCSVVLRRDTLVRIGGFQHVPGLPLTDFPTMARLGLAGPFAFVERVMGSWRRHPASTTWARRRAIETATRDFARAFAASDGVRHGFTSADVARIRRSWDGWVEFLDGRQLLLERRWTESRGPFLAALRGGSPVMRAAALAGLGASIVHRDLEPLIRRAGKIDARTSGIVP